MGWREEGSPQPQGQGQEDPAGEWGFDTCPSLASASAGHNPDHGWATTSTATVGPGFLPARLGHSQDDPRSSRRTWGRPASLPPPPPFSGPLPSSHLRGRGRPARRGPQQRPPRRGAEGTGPRGQWQPALDRPPFYPLVPLPRPSSGPRGGGAEPSGTRGRRDPAPEVGRGKLIASRRASRGSHVAPWARDAAPSQWLGRAGRGAVPWPLSCLRLAVLDRKGHASRILGGGPCCVI